jgi:adenylate kinase
MAAKPMTIPSKYSNYATQNNLFNLFQFMLEELLVAKPDDPLTFLQNILKRPTTNAPKIAVYGPPTSGQHSLVRNIFTS